MVTHLKLSLPEGKQLMQQLIDGDNHNVLNWPSGDHAITDDVVEKHPIFKLAGRWTKGVGDERMQAIEEARWIDNGTHH